MGQIDLKSGFQQVRAGADGFQVGERNFADECIPTGAALEELAELLLAVAAAEAEGAFLVAVAIERRALGAGFNQGADAGEG